MCCCRLSVCLNVFLDLNPEYFALYCMMKAAILITILLANNQHGMFLLDVALRSLPVHFHLHILSFTKLLQSK